MLFRLAFANVWRRISRSTLTLLAMAMAASVLTAGLSLSQGTTRAAFREYRDYYGGDILVMSPGFIGASPVQPSSDVPIEERILADSAFSQLALLFPDFAVTGYLGEQHWRHAPLNPDRLDILASYPGVMSLTPHLTLPVYLNGTRYELKPLPSSYGAMVTLPTADALVMNSFPSRRPAYQPGERLTVMIPVIKIDADGLPFADYAAPSTAYEFTLAEKISWPTRVLTWSPEGGGDMRTEQGYVHAHELYVPQEEWLRIWQSQADAAPYPVTSVSLTVEDMSLVNTLARAIAESFPELAVMPVPSVARHVERYALLDRFYQAPAELWAYQGDGIDPYAPLEFGMITSILLYLNAGMLLASQMLASIASRRNEIGILKAIGGRNREVVGMILLEALILAIIGAGAGFTLVRAAGIHQAVTNRVGLGQIILSTFREAGIVAVLTGSVSLLFGALPAWRVARLTVMDVFRNE